MYHIISAILFVGCYHLFVQTEARGEVRINELCALNYESAHDEDNESPDWIELYNAGDALISLDGYRISDVFDFDTAWEIPDTTLPPGASMLIWASGKNRSGLGYHAIEAAGFGAETFNSWDSFHFEYVPLEGDFDIIVRATSLGKRNFFTKSGLMVREKLDSASRYIGIFCTVNGEFWYQFRQTSGERFGRDEPRTKLNFPNGWLRQQRIGSSVISYVSADGFCWDVVDSTEFSANATLYVGLYASSRVSEIYTRATFTDFSINGGPGNFAELIPIDIGMRVPSRNFTSRELHTDFQLSSAGETAYIWNASGELVDSLVYGKLPTDIAFGRGADGNEQLAFFENPTPAMPNSDPKVGIATVPEFSIEGGAYTGEIVLILNAEDDGVIRYTRDGSEPTAESPPYDGQPITIDTTTAIRARIFKEDFIPGATVTHTYIIDESTTLPVLSLVSDPQNLWSEETGIFAMGSNAAPNYPHFGANFWQTWERPFHTEFWEEDGELAFRQTLGARINGQIGSRLLPQKPLRLYARDRYGAGKVSYRLFGSNDIRSYKRFLLRNSGNDWGLTYLRDALAVSIFEDSGLDVMAYRPATVYINGMYWGVQNLRERTDEYYFKNHYDIAPDQVDILELNPRDALINHGSCEDYVTFIDSLSSLDVTDDKAYAYVTEKIDVPNFTDYYISQIYSANIDWPFKNVKFWRPRTPEGKWRWLPFDFDLAFGNPSKNDFNVIARVLDIQQTDQIAFSQPPWPNFIMLKLQQRRQYTYDFLNRLADILNTTAHPQRVRAILDDLAEHIEPETARHAARWDSSMNNWAESVERIRDFVAERPALVRQNAIDHFQLPGESQVRLNVSPARSGSIRISTIKIEELSWNGIYFQGVPVEVQAIACPGFTFERWSDPDLPRQERITLNLPEAITITAVFRPDPPDPVNQIVINEIMYKPGFNTDTKDWIELVNASKETRPIGGWLLKDEQDTNVYEIPLGVELKPGEFLVVCEDVEAFGDFHPTVQNVIGGFDFGFGTDDQVRLYDRNGTLIDSVAYLSELPWPATANGSGPSIELLGPDFDNTIPNHWRAAVEHLGTPGRPNSKTTDILQTTGLHALQFFPNPFSENVVVELHLERPAKVHVTLLNILGQEAFAYDRPELLSVGAHTLRLAAAPLAKGMYIGKVEIAEEGTNPVIYAKNLIKVK